MKLLADKIILAGGDWIGKRGFAFIIEAGSHEDLLSLLRDIPLWLTNKMEVVPLAGWEDVTAKEYKLLERIKSGN